MQAARGTNEKKAKLARSYQELLDEFSNTDLKTVGNYHLGRLIGKGSFGKVYLASHKLTNGSKVRHDTWEEDGGLNNKSKKRFSKMIKCWIRLTSRMAGRAQVRKEG